MQNNNEMNFNMSKNVKGFNENGVISARDEVISYLNGVTDASSQVSYTLPEDDELGQRFEIMIYDNAGIPKGAINLTVMPPRDNGTTFSLSAAGDYGDGPTQTLTSERVDQILKQATQDSGLEARYLGFVTSFTTTTSEGFNAIEPVITDVLDQASGIIASTQHNINPEKVSSQENQFTESKPFVLQ